MDSDKDITISICVRVSPSVKEEFYNCCSIENKFVPQIVNSSFVLRESIDKYINKIKKKYKNDL